MQTRLALRVVLCGSSEHSVILHPTKRREKRMRARHVCEVGGRAGRGPVLAHAANACKRAWLCTSFCMAVVNSVILHRYETT